MSGPLADLRVVELCDELGQLAGKLLADMGADVIKVEPPGGSSARRVGPFAGDIAGPNRSLNFWYHNTNKRSVVLDLDRSEADRAAFRDLVASANVVLEDREPGNLAALGLGYDALAAIRPDLVMCSITPFGQTGPWAHYRSSDLVALALGGPMSVNGYDPGDAEDAPPIRGHGDQGYNTACHYAAHGTLAAVLYRDTTGRGQYIDCSMHEALSCTVEVAMPYWLYKRQEVIRQTGRHAAVNRTEPMLHTTADGVTIHTFGIGRDNSSWRQLKEWMQSKGFGRQFDDPRFDDAANRQAARGTPESKEIAEEIDRFFAALPAEEVYRGGQERDQAWGIVRSPDETLTDPHWHDRGFFVETIGEGASAPAAMPGAPYIFSATPWELRRPAPKLGEHTAEVMAELAEG